MTSELKPCPFCLRPLKRSSGKFNPMAVCETDGCWMKEKQIAVPCDDPFSVKSWNTRAVPDVPELVRYKPDYTYSPDWDNMAIMPKDENGEYVLYSQAAEIIAAKDAEIERLKPYGTELLHLAEAVGEEKDPFAAWETIEPAIERAEAAEAKLAQYEAQEAVGYIIKHPRFTDDFQTYELSEGDISNGYTQVPLYASPAPAADLRAENERLREALKPFAEYMHTDEGRLDLDNLGNELPDNDHVGWLYLNHKDFRAARAALNVEASNDKG